MESNEKLLNSLVGELKPVRPLLPPYQRALLWILPQVIIALVILHLSSSIEVIAISDIQFVLQVLIAVVALIVGSYLGFVNTIPGLLNEAKSKLTFLPFLLLILLVGINFFFPTIEQNINHHRPYCSIELMGLMILGFAHNFYMINKGFVAFKDKAILTSLLTSAMIPLVALYFTCSFSTDHILKAHYLPVVVITSFIFISYKLIKKYISM